MNIKQSILVIFTIIFLLLSIIFIGFEAREIPKDQNAVIDGVLEKICPEIKSGRLTNQTINDLPPNYFYAIWVENNDESWTPLIVDNNLSINVADGPTWIPTEFSWSARTYLKSIDDINFMVWINKYNSEFYIKNIILVSLFLLLFYLILVLVISLLFFDYGHKTQASFDEAEEDDNCVADDIADKEINSDLADTVAEYEIKSKNEQNAISEQSHSVNNISSELESEKDNKIDITVSQEILTSNDDKEIVQQSQPENENKEMAEVIPEENDEQKITEANQEIHSEENKEINQSSGLLSKAENMLDDEGGMVYEHKIDGDQVASVKFTDEEFQALTQPIEYDENAPDEDDAFYLEMENNNRWQEMDLKQQAQVRFEALVEGYKRLWSKTIKMSDNFKSKFDFSSLSSLVRLGMSASDYISSVLAIGSQYFAWDECAIFNAQDGQMIDLVTGDKLEETNLDIPTKGDKKGQMYVPLFPFSSEDLFGYFYFKWTKIENFKLTDLMYYLKLVFSKESCFIFDRQFQSEMYELVGRNLNKGKETGFAVISVDNRDKIAKECSESEVGLLNQAVFKRLVKDFRRFEVVSITPLKYAIVTNKFVKEKVLRIFDKWICASAKNVYSIGGMQNFALSFSCGISFKSDNAENLASEKNMMERAESLLRVSINQGGNKISIQK